MTAYATALVSDDELQELTGYEMPGHQIKWLTRNGIGYKLRRDGRPRTTWGAVDAALLGELAHSEPNFDSL